MVPRNRRFSRTFSSEYYSSMFSCTTALVNEKFFSEFHPRVSSTLYCVLGEEKTFFFRFHRLVFPFTLLRGIIVNRTYGIH